MTQFDDTRMQSKITDLHHAEEERLVASIAPKYGYPYANLLDVTLDIEALRLLTEEESRRAELAVFARNGQNAMVAVRNPRNPDIPLILEKLEKLGITPIVHLVSLQSITHAWERYRDVEAVTAETHGVLDVNPSMIKMIADEIHTYLDVGSKVVSIQREGSTTKTSSLIEVIFGGALALSASDIHIEPEQHATRIRYRLDGVLVDVCDIEKKVSAQIVSRLKLISGLKLNMHNVSQDGRFTFDVGSHEIEVRSSVIPGAYGESMVMRLLDPNALSFKIENLGLSSMLFDLMIEELERPNGAIITTGPTGSGKTSALYSFLLYVHRPSLKILTLEDPIEYKLPGIVQSQISPEYSFAEGLRSMLRQDPDIILIGEIRDRETAETAIHTALTGHLIFSTLHTNSAAGAIARLVDIGVDPRMIGSAVNIILGQRLVRLLCPHCKKERDITTEEQKLIQRVLETPIAIHTIFDSVGCEVCGMSGYKGRTGVFEAILIDEKVEEAILIDTRDSAVQKAASHQGIPTMQQDALYKVLGGITSLDEVSRVLDLYHFGEG